MTKSEEERALAGLEFNVLAPELASIKKKAHELSRRYGLLDESQQAERQGILQELLGDFGSGNVQGPIFFNYGCHTHIGQGFFGNYNLTVLDDAEVLIGNGVLIGPNCSLVTPNHPLAAEERKVYPTEYGLGRTCTARKIVIGDNVWLAANVTVIGGVTIGENAVIGAGSVVTQDIPANSLAVGNPCRVIRQLDEQN